MKLFVDDLRDPPDDTWTVARTAEAAIALLSSREVEELSLDHDLGEGEDTGYCVAAWLEEKVWEGWSPPRVLEVHSLNPVGARRIRQAFRAISRIVEERGGDGHYKTSPVIIR